MTKNTHHRSQSVTQYAERAIRNQRDLLEYIQALDEDEGIRIQGNLKNHAGGGFIFVGFYRGSYCVNICDKVWNARVRKFLAGGHDEWYYFDTGKQAFDFAMKEAMLPLRAWLY